MDPETIKFRNNYITTKNLLSKAKVYYVGQANDEDNLSDGYNDDIVEEIRPKKNKKLKKNQKGGIKRRVEKEVNDEIAQKEEERRLIKNTYALMRQDVHIDTKNYTEEDWDRDLQQKELKKAADKIEEDKKNRNLVNPKDLTYMYFNVCFYCRQKGHLKLSCPYKKNKNLRHCFKCFEKNYTVRTCPNCNKLPSIKN